MFDELEKFPDIGHLANYQSKLNDEKYYMIKNSFDI